MRAQRATLAGTITRRGQFNSNDGGISAPVSFGRAWNAHQGPARVRVKVVIEGDHYSGVALGNMVKLRRVWPDRRYRHDH